MVITVFFLIIFVNWIFYHFDTLLYLGAANKGDLYILNTENNPYFQPEKLFGWW